MNKNITNVHLLKYFKVRLPALAAYILAAITKVIITELSIVP